MTSPWELDLDSQPCIFTPGAGEPWAAKATELTPWERRNGRWYKREDAFAPLGYGGPNGSKLRQLIHLVGRYVDGGGHGGIVTGASVLSPQLSMTALVARHFGLPCLIVLGGTRPDTAMRHRNVALAAAYGASFTYTSVGYNTALQRAVARVAADHPDWYHLHYGITTPPGASPFDVAAFHAVGAAQVRNTPRQLQHLVVPFGSANTAASVLTGLSLWADHNVALVTLMAIGPDRTTWLSDRLVVGLSETQNGHRGELMPECPSATNRRCLRWASHGCRRRHCGPRMVATRSRGVSRHDGGVPIRRCRHSRRPRPARLAHRV